MNFPFLRHLPSLGRRPLHRIVAVAGATGAEAALQQLLDELPELLLAVVVAIGSVQVLASYASQPRLKPSAAAPFWIALTQQLQASQAAQSQGQEQPEEVLTTLASQLHLLRLGADGQHLLYLMVEERDTNLALAREVMRQAMNSLTTTD